MLDKSNRVVDLITKLKMIASEALAKNVNTSLAALSFASETMYTYNQ